MFKKILLMIGYTKAPKATYMARHPVKGTSALLAAKGAKGLFTTKAGAVLGALVAVPVGLLALKSRGNKNDD